ncbi:unnamed protein product [Protopolystoma xenopodis]|uniref:Uncharacterized protein n=1 Tax=Protopolystoma xenopodis TaxID=117903 RepID=A0A3S5CPM4_9PLAT|nr:unnamed protein product [Protopolystoma xenopodis]
MELSVCLLQPIQDSQPECQGGDKSRLRGQFQPANGAKQPVEIYTTDQLYKFTRLQASRPVDEFGVCLSNDPNCRHYYRLKRLYE